MATSPTQLTLAKMRKEGYLPWITEYYNFFDKKRHDLWTFCDVICVRDNEVLAVQCTSYDNISARVKKIRDCEYTPDVRKAGIRIVVQGWRKVNNRWQCKEVDLS